jgi:Arc/MetJ-type ribon-helix-helix transcriptional regulator
MTRILVSIPDDLHDLLREVAGRNRTSMSKLILAAVEDTYEDEMDAIAGERALARHMADPSSTVSWDEVKVRLRAQAEASMKRGAPKTSKPIKTKEAPANSRQRKKVGIQS